MDLNMDLEGHEAGAGVEVDPGAEQHDDLMQQQQEQEQEQEQQGEDAAQQQQPLTGIVNEGLEAMASRRQEIHAKIDELSQLGVNFLESTKAQFLQLLDNYKKEVDEFCGTVDVNSRAMSDETVQGIARLQRAQQLVESLGLGVNSRNM